MVSAQFDNWLLFTVFFTLLLVVSYIMMKQSQEFYTKDPIVRKFSIMELELPATAKELTNLVNGLYQLEPLQSKRAIGSLRGQLLLDFLFMPLAYGSIFLLSWRVASKMQLGAGRSVFIAFAFAQVIPWICDIIENVYLLGKIKPNLKETDEKKHKQYLWMEAAKWGISLTATVCCISAVCYFWLTGQYSDTSFWYLLVLSIEVVVFAFAVKLSSKEK